MVDDASFYFNSLCWHTSHLVSYLLMDKESDSDQFIIFDDVCTYYFLLQAGGVQL